MRIESNFKDSIKVDFGYRGMLYYKVDYFRMFFYIIEDFNCRCGIQSY